MEQKRLYRSVTNRKICGVCGGLGEYFNIDPTLIRLGGVLLACVSCGTAVVAYFVAQLSFRIRNKNKRALPIKKRQKEKKSEVMFSASFIIIRYKCIKSVIGETL